VLFLCRGLFLFGIPQDVEPQDPGSYSRLRLTKLCKLRHGTPAEVDGVGWRRNETKRNGVEVPFSSSVPLWVSCALAYITSSKCYNLEPLPHFLAIVNALLTHICASDTSLRPLESCKHDLTRHIYGTHTPALAFLQLVMQFCCQGLTLVSFSLMSCSFQLVCRRLAVHKCLLSRFNLLTFQVVCCYCIIN